MTARAPFEVRTWQPVAGEVREVVVPGGVWALELQDGVQAGTRLGLTPTRSTLETIPLDARGQRVPLDGVDRFWLHWPDTLTDDERLRATLWTTPGRYELADGEHERLPSLYLLHNEDEAVTGAVTVGPWNYLPDDLLEVGKPTRMPRGARLVGYFGSTGSSSFDVRLQARAFGSATWRMVKGWRGTGVPSAPTTTLAVGVDEPVPPGEFRFLLGGTAATVTTIVYLLLD